MGESAAGLDAVPEDWNALCSEIRSRPGGLGDILAALSNSPQKGMLTAPGFRCRDASDASSLILASKQRQSPDAGKRPSSRRECRDLECRRCGSILDYRPVAAKPKRRTFQVVSRCPLYMKKKK